MKGLPNHFKRARQMFAAIAVAMTLPMAAQLAAMDKRDARKARNKRKEKRHA